jgi:hypothetical protein
MTLRGHQPFISHCPVALAVRACICNRFRLNKNGGFLIKRNANANLGFPQHILAVNPDYLAALDTGKLSLFPCQSDCPRKVKLHSVAWPNRHRHRKPNENARFADVAASPIKKPVSIGNPNTYRPGKVTPIGLTLFN